MYSYYVDELMIVLDEYADMHKSDKDRRQDTFDEVYADELD